jgi:hypothetical protein
MFSFNQIFRQVISLALSKVLKAQKLKPTEANAVAGTASVKTARQNPKPA